jgi:heme-degrading monooxygenase HmoA
MFTRHVTMKLKRNAAPELSKTFENVVIPMLHKQTGFRGEITFVAPERREAVSISFWETKEDAEAYNRAAYPEMLQSISTVVEKNPKVETFEVANSTFHRIAARAV